MTSAQAYAILKQFDEALNDLNDALSCGCADKQILGQVRALKLSEHTACIAASFGHHWQAYAQRGIVKTMVERASEPSADALADFRKAAGLGNSFAKQQLARYNPYAKLCNAMIKDMLTKQDGSTGVQSTSGLTGLNTAFVDDLLKASSASTCPEVGRCMFGRRWLISF
jgi:hypothetical protein